MDTAKQVSAKQQFPLKFLAAGVLIAGVVIWLAVFSASRSKSYYKTISELEQMGAKAYTVHLRVAGNVVPGSIHHRGSNATFMLVEQGKTLQVDYEGMEPPPDTFKDDAQALAVGTYGHDGVFHATQLQAKCTSKYAPKAGATPPASSSAM